MTDLDPTVRLVVSDVDGTLLDRDKRVTDRALAAIRRLERAGIGFTLVSARPPRAMLPLLPMVEARLPFAAFNGGVLANPDGATLGRLDIDAEATLRSLAMLDAPDVEIWAFLGDDWVLRHTAGPYTAKEERTLGYGPRLVEDFAPFAGRITKLMGVCPDHDRLAALERAIAEAVGDGASVARSQPYFLDITHARANKGAAVVALAGRLGVPLNQVAVLGDMANDVSMFQVAGVSIAMGNASPQVQSHARFVTETNEREGFARAIERHVLGLDPDGAGA